MESASHTEKAKGRATMRQGTHKVKMFKIAKMNQVVKISMGKGDEFRDKAMEGVDFVDLVSSVELNAIEGKNVCPQKPNRYKNPPYQNFTKKRGRRNKEFG
ncbi:hypothetical protein WN944_019734 [Citrus x changshan-huyou]|uniref:Uncharacterized protein n=1 Tax=Citrus x changshan-huyou TaxID=2935761 RepID=A0AAP0LVV1_9ROSI